MTNLAVVSVAMFVWPLQSLLSLGIGVGGNVDVAPPVLVVGTQVFLLVGLVVPLDRGVVQQ